jgi:putative intracellular protease/amidase
MKIAYVLYPDFTALDLIGPYAVISRWPDVECTSSRARSSRCGVTTA